MLRLYGLSLLSLSAGLVACATAVPISIHDRGPCPDAADGVCVPNRRTFGFYSTKWRPWPGRLPQAVTGAGRRGVGEVPDETKPYELPPVEEEETFGRPGGAPLPSAVGGPSGPPAAGPPAEGAEGDLPPKPPLDSEDAPPIPPPGLRDGGPATGIPEGPAAPSTPKAGPPLGAYRPVRPLVQPTNGQRMAGLQWRERSARVPATIRGQRLVPVSTGQRQRSSNPLREQRRPPAEMASHWPSRPAPVARQVAYTAAQPVAPRPAPVSSQGRLRPNPLRQQ